MERYDVIILGGGLAGLSAAVELSSLGRRVCLLEQRRHVGGRVYSFSDPISGTITDNGQHVMLGCYHAARHYMHLIGTEHLTRLQPTLRIPFLHPEEGKAVLSCPHFPAPWHVLAGLFRFKAVPFWERILLLRVGYALFRTTDELNLDTLAADEWLKQLGQSERSRKFLWDVIIIGALNNHPENVSALMLFRVLRAAFFGRRENASLLIPSVGLSELFVDPAIGFIKSHGGEVLTGVEVENLTVDGTQIRSVQTTDGRDFFAKSFISSVPWYAFEKFKLIGEMSDGIFHSSPIISIQIQLDRTVMDEEFAALIDTRIQWVFNKSWKAGEQMSRRPHEHQSREIKQNLSLVISGAEEFIDMGKEELIAIALEDLKRVLPKVKAANVLHAFVMKEKRATFSPSPGLDAVRPAAVTKFQNLFLAGDWTDTGFPATIEGAVLSGKKAAELIQRYL